MDNMKDIDIQSLIKKIASGKATSADIEKLIYAYSEVQKAKQSLNEKITTPEKLESHFKEQVKSVKENQKILKEVTNIEEDILELHEEAMHLIKDKIDTMILEGEYTAEELKQYQKLYKEYANRARRKHNHLLSIRKGEEYTSILLQATLGLSTEWQGISAGGFLKGFIKQLKSAASITNVLSSLAGGMIQQVLAFDTAAADLFKQTGISRSELDIQEIRNNIDAIGVGIPGKIQESVSRLHASYRGFQTLSVAQVNGTAQLMTVLGEMGASQQAMGEIFAFHKHTLQQSPEQANRTLLEMRAFSRATGRHIDEIMTEYAKSIPILAMYEHNSKNIFKGLSREAQILNMEVSKLLGMSLKMDSFEGAAKAAQNFNVAFGGPFLSAQALMGASVDEKFKLIADAFKKSGVKLSRRQISGLARDTGTNEQELLQILNRESDKINNTTEKLKSTEEEMADAQNLIKNNLDIQTTILAGLEKMYSDIGDKFSAKENLRKVLNKIAGFLEFVADNFSAIFKTLLAIKGFQMVMSLRGATPMNPTFVMSNPLGRVGGRFGAGLMLAGGAAAVGGLGYYAVNSRMDDLSERVEAQNQQSMNYTKQATNNTNKRFKEQDKVNQGTFSALAKAGGMSAKQINDITTAKSAEPQATAQSQAGVNITMSTPGSRGGSQGGSPGGTPRARRASTGSRSTVRQARSNDRFGPMPMSRPSEVRVTNNNVNQEANYVQPVFHKNDKFYNVVAAKPGGDLIAALASLQDSLDQYYEMRKNSRNELNMEGREFVRAWKENINEYG